MHPTRKHKTFLAGLATAGIIITGIAGLATVASAKPVYQPAIKIVSDKPNPVKHSGGTVEIDAKLSGPFAIHAGDKGQFCRLSVVSKPVFKVSVIDGPSVEPCWSTVTFYLGVGANPTPGNRAVALELTVSHVKQFATKVFYVTVLGSPATLKSPGPASSAPTTSTPAPIPSAPGGPASTPTTAAPVPTTSAPIPPTTSAPTTTPPTTVAPTTVPPTTTPPTTVAPTTTVALTTATILGKMDSDDDFFTAFITGADGTPTGTVTWTFTEGSGGSATTVTGTSSLNAGVAVYPPTDPSVLLTQASDVTSMTIAYSGDSTYYPATETYTTL